VPPRACDFFRDMCLLGIFSPLPTHRRGDVLTAKDIPHLSPRGPRLMRVVQIIRDLFEERVAFRDKRDCDGHGASLAHKVVFQISSI